MISLRQASWLVLLPCPKNRTLCQERFSPFFLKHFILDINLLDLLDSRVGSPKWFLESLRSPSITSSWFLLRSVALSLRGDRCDFYSECLICVKIDKLNRFCWANRFYLLCDQAPLIPEIEWCPIHTSFPRTRQTSEQTGICTYTCVLPYYARVGDFWDSHLNLNAQWTIPIHITFTATHGLS